MAAAGHDDALLATRHELRQLRETIVALRAGEWRGVSMMQSE